MSKRTDRGLVLKQLNAVQQRAARGHFTNEDFKIIANTLIRLTKLVYEPLIEEEEREKQAEANEKILEEMDWHDFN